MVKCTIIAIILVIGFILAEYDRRRFYTPRDQDYYLLVFLWWTIPILVCIGYVIESIVKLINKIF